MKNPRFIGTARVAEACLVKSPKQAKKLAMSNTTLCADLLCQLHVFMSHIRVCYKGQWIAILQDVKHLKSEASVSAKDCCCTDESNFQAKVRLLGHLG